MRARQAPCLMWMDVTIGNMARPAKWSVVHMCVAIRSTRRGSPVAINAEAIVACAVDSYIMRVQFQVARDLRLPNRSDKLLGDTTITLMTHM